MIFNLYCDESNHLAHSNNDVMTLGFISCVKDSSKQISKDLRNLKSKYNLNVNYELKWTKVSMNKIDYYKELIDYFFDNNDLRFRVVIADKSELDFNKYYYLDHDKWYYRVYYMLLGKTLLEKNKYNIYIDIKDTCSSEKVAKLKEVLNNSYYDFTEEMICKIQHIKSHESELLQLNDLLIGAIGYKNNNLHNSTAKLEIVRYLEEMSGESLISSTNRHSEKFNLFKWVSNYGR